MPDFNILTCVAPVKNKNVKDEHFITRQEYLFFIYTLKKSFSKVKNLLSVSFITCHDLQVVEKLLKI